MALNVANFSTRLGALFGYANTIATQASPLYVANLSSVLTTFDGTNYRNSVGNLADFSNNQMGLPATIGVIAYQNILESINSFVIDAIRQEESVFDGTMVTALKRLQSVMTTNSKSFAAVGTSSLTYTAGSGNQGSGTILARAYRPASSSIFLQEMFTETLNGSCIVGGNVSNFGAATFSISGLGAVPQSNTVYPTGVGTSPSAGSGVRTNITCTSASLTSSLGTPGFSLLSNGDFESWSATNTPTNWEIVTGTAGTQITRGSVAARGTYALQFVGDGTTLTRVRQQIASANGAPASVSAETNYSIMFMAKISAAATGTVLVALRDSSGNVVGSAITLNLASLTTSYVIQSTSFSVARGSLPTTLYLDIYSTTAIQSAKTLMIDELIFSPMTPLYAGGPSVTAYSGSTDWNADDTFKIAVVSDSTTTGKFMKSFARWCKTESLGIFLPVSASPTEADALVTV